MSKGIVFIGAIILLVIFSYFAISYLHIDNLFSTVQSTTPISQCSSSITNLKCGQQVGGVITSLSQVSVNSNFGPLNGPVWLVNFVLNGAGQFLFGTSAQQIAQQLNSSSQVRNNYNIQITSKLDSQNLVIPYTSQGTQLVYNKADPIVFSFSWFSNGAGFATICNQEAQSTTNSQYDVACTGPLSQQDFVNVFDAYAQECDSTGGRTFMNASAGASIGGLEGVEGYALQCYGVTSNNVAAEIMNAGSPSIAENISIQYSNSTGFSTTLYLNSVQPENSYANQLFAQVYGYATGSLNTYVGTESPTLAVLSNGTTKFLPFTSLQNIQTLNELPASCFQSVNLNLGGAIFTNIYDPTEFFGCLTQQNNNVNDFLSEQLQPTNPYYGIRAIGALTTQYEYPSSYSGSGYYGVVNVTSNPVYYPEMQLISNAQSLGIYIPVAYPTLQSVSPNPLKIESGSEGTATFDVYNNASVGGSAYIIVKSANGTIVGQSPNFNVPAHTSIQESISLSVYNPGLANLQQTFTATVYSTEMDNISNSLQFGVIINPNCPTGYVYVNNTNCQSEIKNPTACHSGYYWNGTGCHFICSAPAIFNITTNSCYEVPPPTPKHTDWTLILLEILIPIAAFAVIILYLKMRK